MEEAMTLLEALTALDHDNEAHWTEKGAPSLEALGDLMGERPKRAEVDEVAPGFKRGGQLAASGEGFVHPDNSAEFDAAEASKVQDADEQLMEELRKAREAAQAERDGSSAKLKSIESQMAEVGRRLKGKNTRTLAQQASEYIETSNRTRAEDAEAKRKLKQAGLDKLLKD